MLAFLPDLPDRRVSGVLSGLDLARDECPQRLAIIAPGHQDAETAGNDGGNHRESCHLPDYGTRNRCGYDAYSTPARDAARRPKSWVIVVT